MTGLASPPLSGPISHLCYEVDDLAEAAAWWRDSFGAGPFLLLEDIRFGLLETDDEPAAWEHSAAFGQWGDIAVEIQAIDRAEPASVAARLGVGEHRLTHVSYIVDDPESVSAELDAAGFPRWLHAVWDPIEIFIHDAPRLGHGIELHKRGEMVEGFFATVAELAVSWDGAEPLRLPPEA